MNDEQTTSLAVPFGSSSAENPPYPAQQHLDQADEPLGDGGALGDSVSADDYADVVKAQGYDQPDEDEDEDEEPPAPTTDEDSDFDVPGHTDDEVLAWVGEDVDKAQAALDAEEAQADPREDLVEALTEIADPAPAVADEVPDGNIDEVLAWVGGDKAKAQQALDAEKAKTKPRSSLIEDLQHLVDE